MPPLVEGLVVAHLGATALLLIVFSLVVLWQGLARAFRHTPDAGAARSSLPPAVPGQAAPVAPAAAPASVLDWTIDLRGPREAGAQLQTS